MCLSLQGITASIVSPGHERVPQLGLFTKGRCHKTMRITANISKFLPKVSESSRLGENPSDRRAYHGNSCILEGHKN